MSDTIEPEESDPAAASGGFAAGAPGLAQVGSAVGSAQTAAAAGSVTLRPDSAAALLNALTGLQQQTADLVQFASGNLDQQLHLGHNWVGQAMDTRLHSAVSGKSGAVQPVLEQFQQVLQEVVATVQQAAGLTVQTDEQVAQSLGGTSANSQGV